MRVKILGSAAGGGFPQWNCACSNCHRLRTGTLSGLARTQAQLAWEASPGAWTLLNASPDLRAQIEATPELWPQPGADGRRSPITDVILTGAEVDQAVGLLLLREFHRFHIHATAAVRRLLTEDNSLFGVLARFEGQATWRDIPLEAPFTAGGACLEAIPLAGGLPGFASPARVAASNPDEAVIGVLMAPAAGGGTLAFLPGIGQVSDALLERLDRCEALLFDGTFWSDDEPMRIPGINRTARAMGHMPISGECGTLNRLKDVRRPRKIFIHINNTNPILDEDSEEHQQVRAAGWEIARDGMEVEL